MTAATAFEPLELDSRRRDGVEVSLLWYSDVDVVAVQVVDERVGHSFQLVVDAEEALDVFRHPFAYAAFRGMPLGLPSPDEAPLAA